MPEENQTGNKWRNRIVGHSLEDPTQLLANPDIGWISEVIVNDFTGHIIDGHARVEDAISEGESFVPCVHVFLDELEEKEAIVTYDPIGSLAVHDTELLDSVIRDVQAEDAHVAEFLNELRSQEDLERDGLGGNASDDKARGDAIAGKWDVRPGDLWTIPSCSVSGKDHRIVCGDSTDPATVASVLLDYEEFTKTWMQLWCEVSKRQLVTPGNRHFSKWMKWFDTVYVAPRIWRYSLSPGIISRLEFSEPIMFMGDDSEWMLYFGSGWKRRRLSDVFDFSNVMSKYIGDHPNPKPLPMWQDIITSFTDPGEIVCDPFLGAGTTMVASEKTGRICCGMELSPRYVAISLERIMLECGLQPRLIERLSN